MSYVWEGDGTPPPGLRIGPGGWALAGLRAGALLALLSAGLAVLLGLRAGERLIAGPRRPLSQHLPRLVSRVALAIIGVRFRRLGRPAHAPASGTSSDPDSGTSAHAPVAMVSNHVSWLDILALNAAAPVTFVAKSDVAGWPFIGWLARATGTLFVRRDPREAAAQVAAMRARLQEGARLLFFPEGTSSDGRRVLRFRTTLFAPFFAEGLRQRMQVQPVTLVYHAPEREDARFYGWWGEMALGPHLAGVLARRRQGRVEVLFHPPLAVADFADRKALARACEEQVRAGLEAATGLTAAG